MFNITKITNGKIRLFSPENVYGEKGKGGMADLTIEPQPEVAKIGQHWTGINPSARELGQKWKVRPYIFLLPNQPTVLVDADGPGCITHLWMTIFARWYRELIIRVYWDHEATPSVECPLGDFFGCGFSKHINIAAFPINANPTGGLNSFFPMPFRRHCLITIENRAPKRSPYFYYAISMEERAVADDEGYFHAQFRRSNPLPYLQDHVILDHVKGCGQYVGTHIGWRQSRDVWWGEGEFKAFIDEDDEFPTYCTTGTEDYFGGAWGFGENFSAPFMGYHDFMHAKNKNLPFSIAGNRHCLYRFHILDPIRFESSIKTTIQALGWRQEHRYLPLQDDISSVAYWYQTEPHGKFPPLGSRDDLEEICDENRDDLFDPSF